MLKSVTVNGNDFIKGIVLDKLIPAWVLKRDCFLLYHNGILVNHDNDKFSLIKPDNYNAFERDYSVIDWTYRIEPKVKEEEKIYYPGTNLIKEVKYTYHTIDGGDEFILVYMTINNQVA